MAEQPLLPNEVRNRIVEVRRTRFGDIAPLPLNPKSHPDFQRQAFRGAVRQVGFGSVPLAYWSAKLDKWAWVDGHMRGDELADYVGDVAFTDFDDKEVEFMLVTLDPISYLARTDTEILGSLLADVQAESAAVQEMIARYAEGAGLFVDGLPDNNVEDLTEGPDESPKADNGIRVIVNNVGAYQDAHDAIQDLLAANPEWNAMIA